MVWNDRRQGRNAPCIDLAQLLHQPQDLAELRSHCLRFGIAYGDASEAGDLADGGAIDGHAFLLNNYRMKGG
jgi:hypothetical protein